jgi:hypothetical protein
MDSSYSCGLFDEDELVWYAFVKDVPDDRLERYNQIRSHVESCPVCDGIVRAHRGAFNVMTSIFRRREDHGDQISFPE